MMVQNERQSIYTRLHGFGLEKPHQETNRIKLIQDCQSFTRGMANTAVIPHVELCRQVEVNLNDLDKLMYVLDQ